MKVWKALFEVVIIVGFSMALVVDMESGSMTG